MRTRWTQRSCRFMILQEVRKIWGRPVCKALKVKVASLNRIRHSIVSYCCHCNKHHYFQSPFSWSVFQNTIIYTLHISTLLRHSIKSKVLIVTDESLNTCFSCYHWQWYVRQTLPSPCWHCDLSCEPGWIPSGLLKRLNIQFTDSTDRQSGSVV